MQTRQYSNNSHNYFSKENNKLNLIPIKYFTVIDKVFSKEDHDRIFSERKKYISAKVIVYVRDFNTGHTIVSASWYYGFPSKLKERLQGMRLTALYRLLGNNYIYAKTLSGRHNTSQIVNNLSHIVDTIKGNKKISYFNKNKEDTNKICDNLLSRASFYKNNPNVLDSTYLQELYKTYDGLKLLRRMGFITKYEFVHKSLNQLDKVTKSNIKNDYSNFVSNTELPLELVKNYYLSSVVNKFDMFHKSKLCLFYFDASKSKIGICVWKIKNNTIRYGATIWNKPKNYNSRVPSKNIKNGLINTAYGRYVKCPNYFEMDDYAIKFSDKIRHSIQYNIQQNGVKGDRHQNTCQCTNTAVPDKYIDTALMKMLIIIFIMGIYIPYFIEGFGTIVNYYF